MPSPFARYHWTPASASTVMRNVISVLCLLLSVLPRALVQWDKTERKTNFPIPFVTSRETDCDEFRIECLSSKWTTTRHNEISKCDPSECKGTIKLNFLDLKSSLRSGEISFCGRDGIINKYLRLPFQLDPVTVNKRGEKNSPLFLPFDLHQQEASVWCRT